METYTIQDMLINSTDIYKLLCGLGIGNASDCKNDSDMTTEPKGKRCFYSLLNRETAHICVNLPQQTFCAVVYADDLCERVFKENIKSTY